MATKCIFSIKNSAGDYPSLTTWEAANQCNLTLASTKVFAHSGITGAIPDGFAVTGKTSGATGTMTHASSGQCLIISIVGTFQSGEQIYETIDTNYVDITDAGDSAIAVAEGYKSGWETTPLNDQLEISGWVTGSANNIIIQSATGNQHTGVLKVGSTYTGFTVKNLGFNKIGFNAKEDYTVFTGIACEMAGGGSSTCFRIDYNGEINRCLVASAILGVHAPVRSGLTLLISNIIAYDCTTSFLFGYKGTVYGYNLQAINSIKGFSVSEGDANCRVYLKNCIGDNNSTADFEYTLNVGGVFEIDYCASSDGTATIQGGTGNQINQTFTFTDAVNDNFKLTAGSTGGTGDGTDLSLDPNYAITDDIIEITYITPFDMGAFNVVAAIPAPVAAFSGTPLSGTAPLSVAFTDASTGSVSSWAWQFGDAQTSVAQNPTNVYAAPGTYTVTLTVTGPGGSDPEVKVDYVTVSAAPVADDDENPALEGGPVGLLLIM